MFANVDMCEIVFNTSESTDYEFSAAIFIELLKFWSEVLTTVSGSMLYVWWGIKGTISGKEDFSNIEKNARTMGKIPWLRSSMDWMFINALI